MSTVSTVNFLPEIFRTAQNQRFLGATFDQLVSDAANVKLDGFIGRTFAPTYKVGDNYVPEISTDRKNYQLEPAIVVKDANGKVVSTAGYVDMMQAVQNIGGIINNPQRLFSSESYGYDGKFDYDKFVNYSNYYWLPDGPAPIQLFSNSVPYQQAFSVVRSSVEGGFVFSGLGGHGNPQLTLARGGNYTFQIDQVDGEFWIQSAAGVDGVNPLLPTVSTRQVAGVTNNGISSGVVQFNVPLASAQDFYILMPIAASVDAAVQFNYVDIQNQLLSEFLINFPLGLDGITSQLQNKTIVFINNAQDDSLWTTPAIPVIYQSLLNNTAGVIPMAARTSQWKINLVSTGSDFIIQLIATLPVAVQQKVFVGAGNTYASTQFWVDNTFRFNPIPQITATSDYLYYQDSANPAFFGQIKLVNNEDTALNVLSDIIGGKGYTSPNGVIFTNGMKVKFDSSVLPLSYYGTAYSSYSTWWQAATDGGASSLVGDTTTAEAYSASTLVGTWNGTIGYILNNGFYVDGVGTAITLTPVDQLVVTESYGSSIATSPDYITINRASSDRNAWSRYNRWFHKDVIMKTALYNNTLADYGSSIRGSRPIIEFQSGLQLFNSGSAAIANVDLITFDVTDAFNSVEGQQPTTIDGVLVTDGQTIVFASDFDTNVKNKVYQVSISPINGANYIRLNDLGIVLGTDTNVLALAGTNVGKTFYFNGTSWVTAQQKSGVNQSPLFDVFDKDGFSFSDTVAYPSSSFAGTAAFGYAAATGTADTILGFPLQYQNFTNIGDIVFTNHYDTDTFVSGTNQIACNSGYLKVNGKLVNNWVTNVEKTEQYQVFSKFFDNTIVVIDGYQKAFVRVDILPDSSASIPYLKVFLNNTLLVDVVDYQLTQYGVYNIVVLTALPTLGDKIDVLVFSSSSSAIGYHEVPQNLSINPLNDDFTSITLGQLRTHYNKLQENSASTNPTQDSYLVAQGGTLCQQSAPLVYASAFLTDPILNFNDGVTLARKEYTRFKNKFLMACTTAQLDYTDPVGGCDIILGQLNSVKNTSFPWYYSDMVPYGSVYSQTTYSVLSSLQASYEIGALFDNTVLGNRAVLVYCDGAQQVLGLDYVFSKISPAIIFQKTLTVGQQIVIRDYSNTDGNYIPETPSKLGLYPAFAPMIYTDTTYQTAHDVILGHDGSRTPVFGDFRDAFLLELELRIYNNIKTTYNATTLSVFDVMPGRFRQTEFTSAEFTQLISQHFLQWVGANTVDYAANSSYDSANPFTWNYGGLPDLIDGTKLQGSWRAVYNAFYDTDRPHTSPWEMLGFSSMPAWWVTRYGNAPYTSGNTVLWDDLAAGYIWNNGAPYTAARFVRPNLQNIIPCDAAGNLLAPPQIPLTNTESSTSTSFNFQVGQQSPAETAWRRSSDYPFAIMIALACAKPATYFGTQLDVARFSRNTITSQFSDGSNQKIQPLLINVNNGTTRTAGYINWIGDLIKNSGIDPTSRINSYFQNLSVQLTHKVGGFTDPTLITVSAEQTSPGSTNASVNIPQSNYQLYMGKSVPVASVSYSAVVVESTANGYVLTGYDTTYPFFVITPSISNGNFSTISANGASVKIYADGITQSAIIPYGTVFANLQQVTDFLISYERFLVTQGFVFDDYDTDLQTTRNWSLSAQEFLFWSQQGFGNNTLIILSPIAQSITVKTHYAIIDEVTNLPNGSKVLDQNFAPIKNNNFTVLRTDSATGNTFALKTVNNANICYAKFNMVQYEHTLVVDNVDDFGDNIYVPNQGTRQYRLKLSGAKTGNWTGAMSAQGFVYNSPAILTWTQNTDYAIGDIVTFNNSYYAAGGEVAASASFNFGAWSLLTAEDIQTGLLPSLGYSSSEFEHFYDVDMPPDSDTFQSLSAGLIGFRERPYLTDLGISIPNQTKFYQGYIKQKGTLNSILALTSADFDNVSGTISTYEEWAFQVGRYGDLSNNQYVEFILDQSIFTRTPVTLTNGNTQSNVAVNVTSANIYASNGQTVSSMYNNRSETTYIADMPTVGYVNVDDVDLQIFDINTVTSAEISQIGVGSKVWVAKNLSGEWDVYRINKSPLIAQTLAYTLDSYGVLTFDSTHSFQAGDIFVLMNFSTIYGNFNNIYTVVSVPNSLSVVIEINDVPTLTYLVKNSPLSAGGDIFTLRSMVVQTTPSIESVMPYGGWINGDSVWVDNATSLGWGVYQYSQPWETNDAVGGYGQFGTAVAASSTTIFVGAPLISTVSSYSYTGVQGAPIVSTDASFGHALASASTTLCVGAPSAGNVHVYINGVSSQVIHGTTGFGTSIAVSGDAHWLYISDSANVSAYSLSGNTYSLASTIGSGNIVKTNMDGSIVIVANAAINENSGSVSVLNRTANVFTTTQTLLGQIPRQNANFGSDIGIDSSATNLFVGCSGDSKIERYVLNANMYSFSQTVALPEHITGEFGSSLSISADGSVLAVGSEGAASDEMTTFDIAATLIDQASTQFIDGVFNSGAVYVFEPIMNQAVGDTIGTYVFVQEVVTAVHTGDNFGAAVCALPTMLICGAPQSNGGDGKAYLFENPTGAAGWELVRQQAPMVDLESIDRTFIYNKTNNNIIAAFDYFDPAKGKLLNSFGSDIDYMRESDPAQYSTDFSWGVTQVGKIWWDLSSVRYINYEQDTIDYRANHWGQLFAGSTINVYQWTESTVPPSAYQGDGNVVFGDASSVQLNYIDVGGNVRTKYYFWVGQKDTVAYGKSNSTNSITASIENPSGQGIAYAQILRDDTVSLVNTNGMLVGTNSVLHLGSKSAEAGLIHSEYALVQEGNPTSKLPPVIMNKLVDSLAGQDQDGNAVPDPSLVPSMAYGVSIRPRQTMFINRALAQSNYVAYVNAELLQYPIVQQKSLTGMNGAESIPPTQSGAYSMAVDSFAELAYIDITSLSNGYAVLVNTDVNNSGKWAIYTLQQSVFVLSRVQSFKTSLYWEYTDYYSSTFDASAPLIIVDTLLEYRKLTLVPSTYIKVLNSGNGNFAIYQIDATGTSTLVGIQNGTIQLSTGAIPPAEMRQMMQALQSQILIDELAASFNAVFFAMVKYALTEQKNLDWVFKTSFLSATQYIRKLEQFPAYIADNQDYYSDYINEVKPFRTILREFVSDYEKTDTFSGDMTDFDLPSYWDSNLGQFRSPNGEQTYDAQLLSGLPQYSQWQTNHSYCVSGIMVENAGTGYTNPPIITISGDGTGATAIASVDGNGGVLSISVTNQGTGFTTYPQITINGIGTGASARAVLQNVFDGNNTGHNLVRSFDMTIKFDRVNYAPSNTFVVWDSLTSANIGEVIPSQSILVFNGASYLLASSYTLTSSLSFPVGDVSVVDIADFTCANDRIASTGTDVPLEAVQTGIDYPGILVDGNTYVGNYFDSTIQSNYTDILGISPNNTNVDGGAYIDAYSGHSPEELVAGRVFDSINIEMTDTNNIAYRTFTDMNGKMSFYRIDADAQTSLSANLGINDSTIYVVDGTQLPNPNISLATPGIVFINGEKITYYRNFATEAKTVWTPNLSVQTDTLVSNGGNVYLTTGNIFGNSFANISANTTQVSVNSLSQIRRGVDGTAPLPIQPVGSVVADASINQTVPQSSISTLTLSANVTYQPTATITYAITMVRPFSANIGDTIVQKTGNVVVSTMQVLQTGTGTLPMASNVMPITGNTTQLYLNSVPITNAIMSVAKVGMIGTGGYVTVLSGSTLNQDTQWTGMSLDSSTTIQSTFLKG